MHHRHRLQSGETLISLMVGMLLSMVVALALVSLFKVSGRTSAQSGQDAAADAQTSLGLIRASTAVQSAGFGIAGAAVGKQLLVVRSATLVNGVLAGSLASSAASGAAVVWSYQPSPGTVQCAGLYFDNSEGGGLYSLGPIACTADISATWNSLDWSSSTVLWVERPAQQASAAYNQSVISFAYTSPTTCQPYGLTKTSGTAQLNISTTNRSGAALTETVCLLNIK
jgi:Tfp pilus assembly protein PilW